jgi:hypothetical protein
MHAKAEQAWTKPYIAFVFVLPAAAPGTNSTPPAQSIPAHVARLCQLHLIPAEFVIYTDNAAFATELPTELHTHFAFKVLPFAKFPPELSGLEIKGEYVALIKPGFFVSEEILFDLGKRYLRQGSMYFALESELKAGTWHLAALDAPERLTTYLTAKWQRPYYLRAAFKKPSDHCRILQEEAFVIVPRLAWDQTKVPP